MELLRGAALLLLLCAAACAQDCECPRSSAPRPLAPRGAAPAAPQNGAPSPLGRGRRCPAAALLSPVGGCGCRPVLGAARLRWVGGRVLGGAVLREGSRRASGTEGRLLGPSLCRLALGSAALMAARLLQRAPAQWTSASPTAGWSTASATATPSAPVCPSAARPVSKARCFEPPGCSQAEMWKRVVSSWRR